MVRNRKSWVKYTESVWDKFEKLKNTFCDLSLKVGDEKINAHRILLAANFEYFESTLLEKGNQGVTGEVINVPDLEPDVLKQCISFIYSGEVSQQQPDKNMENMLKASLLLKSEGLKDACFDKLEENISVNNCLAIIELARTYESKDVEKTAQQFVALQYEEVLTAKALTLVSKDDFLYYLRETNADCRVRWHSIVSWLENNEHARDDVLVDFIQIIDNVMEFPISLMEHILRDPVVQKSAAAKLEIFKVLFSYSQRSRDKGFIHGNINEEEIRQLMDENMIEMIISEKYKNMSLLRFIHLLRNAKFHTEKDKWETALKWIKHKPDRDSNLPDLLIRMNLQRFAFTFLMETVWKEEYVQKSHLTKQIVIGCLFSDVKKIRRNITIENVFALKNLTTVYDISDQHANWDEFNNFMRVIKDQVSNMIFHEVMRDKEIEFVLKNLTTMNDTFTQHAIKDELNNFMLANLDQVKDLKDFMGLSEQDMKDILQLPVTSIAKEKLKLESLFKWVRYDDKRKDVLLDLIMYVDLDILDSEYLKYLLENEKLIKECPGIFSMISRVVIDEDTFDQTIAMLQNNEVRIFDIKTCKSHMLNKIPEGECVLDIVCIGEALYIITTEGKVLKLIDGVHDLKSGLDSSFESYHDKVVAFQGRIYIVNNSNILIFDPVSECWIQNDLPGCGLGSGFCLAASSDYIYAIGGISLKRAKRYDPVSLTWSEIAHLNNNRDEAAATVYNGKIYVIGGYGEDCNAVNSVEVYDPVTNIWTSMSDMYVQHSMACACVINDILYVIGGGCKEDGEKFDHLSIQFYDAKSNQWKMIQTMEKSSKFVIACPYPAILARRDESLDHDPQEIINISAQRSGADILVTWKSISDRNIRYNIDIVCDDIKIGETQITKCPQYILKSPVLGRKYYFKVWAQDKQGNSGSKSLSNNFIKVEIIGVDGGSMDLNECKMIFPSETFKKPTKVWMSIGFYDSKCPEEYVGITPLLDIIADSQFHRNAVIQIKSWCVDLNKDLVDIFHFLNNQTREIIYPEEVTKDGDIKFQCKEFSPIGVFHRTTLFGNQIPFPPVALENYLHIREGNQFHFTFFRSSITTEPSIRNYYKDIGAQLAPMRFNQMIVQQGDKVHLKLHIKGGGGDFYFDKPNVVFSIDHGFSLVDRREFEVELRPNAENYPEMNIVCTLEKNEVEIDRETRELRFPLRPPDRNDPPPINFAGANIENVHLHRRGNQQTEQNEEPAPGLAQPQPVGNQQLPIANPPVPMMNEPGLNNGDEDDEYDLR